MNPSLSSSETLPSAKQPRRQAGRRHRRSEGMKWDSSSLSIRINEKSSPHLARMVCLMVVVAFCSTSCLSFTMPHQRTQERVYCGSPMFQTSERQRRGAFGLVKAMSTSLFSEVATDQESLEEIKKRVNLTIRYSAESGLKPYYLTIAKRVKDHFPDVLIEKIELDKEGGGGGDAESKSNNGETGARTFEVVVDGKIVVRTNQKDGDRESIFVSMTELEFAIARARKRRRPSSVYGENGNMVMSLKSGDKDEFDNSRLEFLKQKALELQRNNSGAGSKKKSAGSSKKKIAVDSTE